MDLTPYKNCLALKNSVFIANEENPYRPCCWFKTYIDATDIDDYKRQLAEVDIETNCDYCIQQDKGGTYSYRQQFNDAEELIITASFDNICNLKCVTCTPNNSTQILAERFKFHDKVDAQYAKQYFNEVVTKQAPKKIDFIKSMLADAKFKKLRFDILGGEPLINPAIFEFVDWLAEQPYAKQTTLAITTNGTTYNEKLLKYIDSFKRVGVQLSIDGIDEEFEYLRYGASFETLEKVCDSFYDLTKKYDNFSMGCHYTLSWLNCLRFSKFFNWMQTRYPDISDIYVSKLQEPNQYSIELLSLDMRQRVYDEVLANLNSPINDSYKKTLFLYKEHMLSTAFGDFDIEKFKYGLSTLTVSDNIRGNEHMEIVHDFISFFKLHEVDPTIPDHALSKAEKSIQKLPESFCSVPWLQIHTEPDGKVFPCCYYSHDTEHNLGNWNEKKIIDIFHSGKWNALRKDFLDGKKPTACTRCWKEEDSGIISMRKRFNERYRNFPDSTNQNGYDKYVDIVNETKPDGSVGDIKLATIDLIFNNLCNMKCRTCGPGLSTSWIADEIKLGRSKITPVSLLTNETVTHMKDDLVALVEMVDPYTEIHFSGGEPMMQADHYQFLQLLIDMGKTKVKIRYNTNLTVYTLKEYNAFEMLQNFDNVFIVGSCDAMGKQGEYIRKGFDWEKALEWIKTCKEYLPNADYGISAVYSLLNASASVDFHRYMCESTLFKRSNGTNFGFYLNTLHEPSWLRTTLLPPDVKAEITEKITKHIEWLTETQPQDFHYAVYIDHWKNAITLMNSADNSNQIPNFYKETHVLDSIRNETFEEVFPELHEKMKPYDK